MQLKSFKISENKHTAFLALLVLSALIVRAFWSFWGAAEYWGDGYHNVWIIKQSLEFGDYFDYKDRHLVWLPAYRFLLWIEFIIFDPESYNNFFLPFLLQLWYMGISLRYLQRNSSLKTDCLTVGFVLFWPLPIIFGGFNMSEGLALCTISSIFYLVGNADSLKNLLLIGFFAAITALSRHEATAFLGIYSILLFFLSNKKYAYSIVVGVMLGLFALSAWNLLLISDPLFWLSSKFNASSSGASDFIESVGFLPRISEALFAVFLVFPFIPFIYKNIKEKLSFSSEDAKNMAERTIFLSTLIFLAVFLIGSLFFFHGADPKYLLLVSLPCSLWGASIFRKANNYVRYASISAVLILVPLYALLFNIRSYNLELERRLGSQLESIVSPPIEGNLWCDFPTTLVYADWDPRKVISTDQFQRQLRTSDKNASELVIENNIEYIIAADYDHSAVLSLFHEMNFEEPFLVGSISFTPIKIMDPITEASPENNRSMFPRLASISLERNKEMVIWKLEW